MADRFPVVTRPDGRIYQPRRIVTEAWDNTDGGREDCGVFVFGTHDVEMARPLAVEAIRGWYDSDLTATKPTLRWVRSGYIHGDRAWIDDPATGRAAVEWTADYPEEETDRA